LWHEFCHVVTLEKTQNRMPRWLSEGISVYEERQRNPAWGQKLTPTFRQWLLDDQIRTPVSRLSEAFLRPRSAQHLQFAYYESSLVVEFLLQELGPVGLQRTLADLAVGMPIEEALQRYLGSRQSIDERFATFARSRAQQDAPELDWQSDLLPPDADRESLKELFKEHPRNYYLLLELARVELKAANPAAALYFLTIVCAARPHDVAAIRLTVQAARDLGDAEAEVRALDQWITADADAIDPRMRRAELARAADDWARVKELAEQLVAVNPLLVSAQQLLADAANQLSHPAAVIASQRALLQLAPQDPAAAYYQLALASQQLGDDVAAKRYVLRALEETPRYRAAQRLLLQLVNEPTEAPRR